jgi:hypothetical protein
LRENHGNLRLQLSIDKSISKTASWIGGLLIGCSVFLGLAIAAAIVMTMEWRDSKIEVRLLQQQVMDQNAILVREGLRQPSDHSNGPAGNLQYERRR